ncbi:MAG: GNAT family N-acetyltransferase [Pseudomonadota bacterium]
MAITIRPCTAADAPALSVLAQATFLETYFSLVAGADIIAHCEEKLSPAAFTALFDEPRTRLWIAESATTAPVGYALACAPDLPVPTAPNDLELRRIYVLAGLYGAGAANLLMNAAFDEARRQQAPRVLLGVNRENARALAFYARHGFIEVGARRYHVGAGYYDDFVLARTL